MQIEPVVKESYLESEAMKSIKSILESIPKINVPKELKYVNKSKTMPSSYRIDYVRSGRLNTDYNKINSISNNNWQNISGYGSNILERPIMKYSVKNGTDSSGGLVRNIINDDIYVRKPIQEQKVNINTKYKDESNDFYINNKEYFEDCKKCLNLCLDRRSKIDPKVNFICNTCMPKCTLKSNDYI